MNFPIATDFYVAQTYENEWVLSYSANSTLQWNLDEPIEITSVAFWGTGAAATSNNSYVGFVPSIPVGFMIAPFQYTTAPGVAFGYFKFIKSNLKLSSGTQVILFNNNSGLGKIILHVRRISSITSENVIKKCDLINWILGRCD